MSVFAGVVLCGGESSRMGRSKAWLDVHGEPLLVRTVRVLGAVVAPVIVVAAPGQELPALPRGTIVGRDAVLRAGPLAGLAAGLELATSADAAFVCATDAPFLHPAFVQRMLDLWSDDAALAPSVDGRVHPLAAVYARSAQPVIAKRLAAGSLRLTALLEELCARHLDAPILLGDPVLASADPELRSLLNVNTPAEYEAATSSPERLIPLV